MKNNYNISSCLDKIPMKNLKIIVSLLMKNTTFLANDLHPFLQL